MSATERTPASETPPPVPVTAGRPSATRPAADGSTPRGAGLAALLLGALVFAVQLTLAHAFDDHGFFGQDDVVFDADPETRLASFAYGRTGGPRTYVVHPILSNYVTPAVALTAKSASLFFGEEAELRRAIAIGVAPLAAALKTAALLYLLLAAGLRLPGAFFGAALAAASFSQLVFGSVPDHWILSGLAMVAVHRLAVREVDPRQVSWLAPWILAGVLATGVTITNGAAVVCLLFASSIARGDAWRATARRAFLFGLTTLVATVLIAGFLALAFRWDGAPTNDVQEPPPPPPLEADLGSDAPSQGNAPDLRGRHFVPADRIATKALGFPVALANTIAPERVSTIESRWPVAPDDRYTRILSFEGEPEACAATVPARLFVWALLIGGAIAWWTSGRVGRGLAAGACVVIAFHFALNAIYGSEYFLYSQHWHVAQVLLLAGIARRLPRAGTVLLAAATLLAIALDIDRVRGMLELLG